MLVLLFIGFGLSEAEESNCQKLKEKILRSPPLNCSGEELQAGKICSIFAALSKYKLFNHTVDACFGGDAESLQPGWYR